MIYMCVDFFFLRLYFHFIFFFYTAALASAFYTLSLHDALPILGGIQPLARSTYAKLLPETEDNTIYFSFYDVLSSVRSEEHTSELQSRGHLVCRLLLEKKKCTQGLIDGVKMSLSVSTV